MNKVSIITNEESISTMNEASTITNEEIVSIENEAFTTTNEEIVSTENEALTITNDESVSIENNTQQHHKIKCSIHVTATSLILIAIMMTIVFTVFRVKDPIITMNNIMINGLDSVMGINQVQKSGANISMIIDVSVNNPNMASFKYSNTTTGIYYKGIRVGEGRGLPGKTRPHHISRMKLTVDIMINRILADPSLTRKVIGSSLVNMSSYTSVGGEMKIMGIVKKNVTVKLNCTMVMNITDQVIQDVDCKNIINL